MNRSPFGNDDICLSPIPKDEKSITPCSRHRRLLSDSADISKHLTFDDMESNENLSSDSDLDDTALEEAKADKQQVRNSSLNDDNLDCSMKSEIGQSWDVSAIIKSEDKISRKTGNAESTHIQNSQANFQSSGNEERLDAIKDDEHVLDGDVCMDSIYGDSRGFRLIKFIK